MTQPIWPADQNYLNAVFGAGSASPAEFMQAAIVYDAQASGNPRFRRAPGIGVYPPSRDELARQLAAVDQSRPHRGPYFAEAGAPMLMRADGQPFAPESGPGPMRYTVAESPPQPGACACEDDLGISFATKQDAPDLDTNKVLKAAVGIGLGALLGAAAGSQKGCAGRGAAIGAVAAALGTVGGHLATTPTRAPSTK